MIDASNLIQRMSVDLGMLPSRLALIIRTAPLRYKVFYIPKRDGTPREVAQPAREVKSMQRWIVELLSTKLPLHSAATAYKSGSSIQKNAERHKSSNYLLKMDFSNFFPSITSTDVINHLESCMPGVFDLTAKELIARVCCWAPRRTPPLRLCIGAPSSPFLSNSLMHGFDCIIHDIVVSQGVEYTRYADDLTFSCQQRQMLDGIPNLVVETLQELAYPILKINEKKTVLASRAGKRVVTGVTLTPDFGLSVGRDRKRLIRAMYHRFIQGKLDESEIQRLNGLIAFVESIEPGFSKKLKGKGFPNNSFSQNIEN